VTTARGVLWRPVGNWAEIKQDCWRSVVGRSVGHVIDMVVPGRSIVSPLLTEWGWGIVHLG